MEITNGKNELAGMAPGCPECGSKDLTMATFEASKDNQVLLIDCEDCETNSSIVADEGIYKLADFAQFFHAPAPTPPLDGKWEQDAFVLLAALKESVVWGLAPSILYEIERLVEEFPRRHIASPAQTEKRDEWVSVDERLPEIKKVSYGDFGKSTAVLILLKYGRSTVAQYCEWLRNKHPAMWVEYSGNSHEPKGVTHWQPLPAAPQSGKEGQT